MFKDLVIFASTLNAFLAAYVWWSRKAEDAAYLSLPEAADETKPIPKATRLVLIDAGWNHEDVFAALDRFDRVVVFASDPEYITTLNNAAIDRDQKTQVEGFWTGNLPLSLALQVHFFLHLKPDRRHIQPPPLLLNYLDDAAQPEPRLEGSAHVAAWAGTYIGSLPFAERSFKVAAHLFSIASKGIELPAYAGGAIMHYRKAEAARIAIEQAQIRDMGEGKIAVCNTPIIAAVVALIVHEQYPHVGATLTWHLDKRGLHIAILRNPAHQGADAGELARALNGEGDKDQGRALITNPYLMQAFMLSYLGMPDPESMLAMGGFGEDEAAAHMAAAESGPSMGEMLEEFVQGVQDGTIDPTSYAPPDWRSTLRIEGGEGDEEGEGGEGDKPLLH